MSKQNKLKAKRLARLAAKQHSNKGPSGASRVPSRQSAPPWIKNGTREPAAVKKRRIELAREAASRKAKEDQAKREAAHAA